jgi:hypothetical protein
VLVNVVLGAFVVGLLPAVVAAGNGVGAAIQMGMNNTVTAFTKLTATTVDPALAVQNQGTGAGLSIQVSAGKAPIYVAPGAGKAVNLNSDLLDGKDSSSFQSSITQLSDLNGISCGGGSLLAITNIECIFEVSEPNNTAATATHMPGSGYHAGTIYNGDTDWIQFDNLVCDPSTCYEYLDIESVNIVMDVFRNGTKVATAVKIYSNQTDPYSGAKPIIQVRIYRPTSGPLVEPYKFHRG